MPLPTIPVLDNFDRANGALGANWALISGAGTQPTISGNKAIGPTSGSARVYWTPAQLGPACAVKLTLAAVSGTAAFLVLRAKDVGTTGCDYYLCQFSNGGAITVIRVDNNGLTTLETANAGRSLVIGDVLAFMAVGPTLSAWLNGAMLTSVDDATYAAAGYAGFALSANTSEAADDWGAVTIQRPPVADLAAPSRRPIEFLLERAGTSHLRLRPNLSSVKFSTLAVGGFGSCEFTLPGPPSRWKREIPYLAMLRVLAPGGRVLWEGRVEDIGFKVSGDSLSTSVTCFGLQRLLSDVSLRRVWSMRSIPWQKCMEISGTPGYSPNPALFFDGANWNALTVGAFDPSDQTRQGVELRAWTGFDSPTGSAMGVQFYNGDVQLQKLLATVSTRIGKDDSVYLVRDSVDGVNWNNKANGVGTDVALSIALTASSKWVRLIGFVCAGLTGINTWVQWEDIRLLGAVTVEDATGGLYGGTILRDLIAQVPGLTAHLIEDGTDFLIPSVDAFLRRYARDVADEVCGYYGRELAVWEDGATDWKQPNLDEPHWLAQVADCMDIDIQGSIDDVYKRAVILYTSAAGQFSDEQTASSSDQRNPFVTTGATKDKIVQPSFPMTPNSAQQLASKAAADVGAWPPIRGSITFGADQLVNHASLGPVPALYMRAGENIVIQDLPKTDWLGVGRDGETFFHVITCDVDMTKKTVTLSVEGQTKRLDTLLAQLASATRVVTG